MNSVLIKKIEGCFLRSKREWIKEFWGDKDGIHFTIFTNRRKYGF